MDFANGNNMTFKYPLYGFFDKNMSKIHIYGLQPFNAYNFGDPVGVCWVAWGCDASSLAQLKSKEDITLTAGDGVLVLDKLINLWLLEYDTFDPNGYTAGSIAAGYKWTKK